MTIYTLADIVPNGTATPLSTDPAAQATFIDFRPSAAGVRVGDAHVASGRGVILPDDDIHTFYPPNFDQGPYMLNQIYLWCAAGVTAISVTYGY